MKLRQDRIGVCIVQVEAPLPHADRLMLWRESAWLCVQLRLVVKRLERNRFMSFTREQVLDMLAVARSQGHTPDFAAANLQRLDLADVDLRGADLRGADLRWTSLCRANLANADLSSANLQGANLQGANLGGANLQRVDLHRADLRAAYLVDAQLDGTDMSRSVR